MHVYQSRGGDFTIRLEGLSLFEETSVNIAGRKRVKVHHMFGNLERERELTEIIQHYQQD